MEMMNRAIEDASDFKEMLRKLQEGKDAERGAIQAYIQAGVSPKHPGENRKQYRERLRRERKAATK